MFRVLLPDGTLTEASRVELALVSEGKGSFVSCQESSKANALVIHLSSYKKPYSAIVLKDIESYCSSIINTLLNDGYCSLSSSIDYSIITETEYNKLFKV